jgi:hypothetical protein
MGFAAAGLFYFSDFPMGPPTLLSAASAIPVLIKSV